VVCQVTWKSGWSVAERLMGKTFWLPDTLSRIFVNIWNAVYWLMGFLPVVVSSLPIPEGWGICFSCNTQRMAQTTAYLFPQITSKKAGIVASFISCS
jgi:hypothetical protein